MTEPTQAGQALVSFLWDERKRCRFDGPEIAIRIADIEAEARNQVIEAARRIFPAADVDALETEIRRAR